MERKTLKLFEAKIEGRKFYVVATDLKRAFEVIIKCALKLRLREEFNFSAVKFRLLATEMEEMLSNSFLGPDEEEAFLHFEGPMLLVDSDMILLNALQEIEDEDDEDEEVEGEKEKIRKGEG